MSNLNQVVGLLLKEESTYGVAESLSNSADGINLYIGDGDPPAPSPYEYVFDGSTGRAAGNLAPQRRTTPNGRFRSSEYQVQPKGLGATYSISALPPADVHRALRACGFAWTYSASPTPQWTAAPVAAGTIVGHTLRQFSQGSQYDATGVLGNLSFETQGLGIPLWTVNWTGVAALPSTQALPAITVEAPSVIAPVASAMTCTIGAFTTATVRRVAFRQNRSIDAARVALNLAGGHAGFIPGGMAPELEIEIERPVRSTFDPETLLSTADSRAVAVTFGSTQYNRWSVSLPQAQLAAVTPGAEGPIATVTLVYRAHASTPSANDFLSFLFN
jgi:hypothetical protein